MMDRNWTSNESEDTTVMFPIAKEWKILVLTLMVAVLFLTVVGNLLVMTVLVKSNVLISEVNSSFLFSLSIADLLVGLLVMPCAIDVLWTGQWRCGATWKQMNAFGNFWFCIASIMNLMVLSLDRYYAIVRPLRYAVDMTQRRVVMICVAVWAYSALWALLPITGVSPYECIIPYIGKCKGEEWYDKAPRVGFTVSVVSGTYGIALVCMFYVHIKLSRIIRHHKMRIAPAGPPSSATGAFSVLRHSKGVVTLVLVIVTYLLCWSPFCILLLVETIKGEKVVGIAGMLTMFIGFVNSCCNPLIYFIRYRKFRLAVRRSFIGETRGQVVSASKTLGDGNRVCWTIDARF